MQPMKDIIYITDLEELICGLFEVTLRDQFVMLLNCTFCKLIEAYKHQLGMQVLIERISLRMHL